MNILQGVPGLSLGRSTRRRPDTSQDMLEKLSHGWLWQCLRTHLEELGPSCISEGSLGFPMKLWPLWPERKKNYYPLSIFFLIWLWGQRLKQESPNFPLPNHFVNLIWRAEGIPRPAKRLDYSLHPMGWSINIAAPNQSNAVDWQSMDWSHVNREGYRVWNLKKTKNVCVCVHGLWYSTHWAPNRWLSFLLCF